MISELLAYDFMQRAILAVIAISIFSPILGLFLILRRQSLMSDTLSHVSLAGVAVGIFLGQSTTWMTLVVVLLPLWSWNISGSVTSIIWRFQRLSSCQWDWQWLLFLVTRRVAVA